MPSPAEASHGDAEPVDASCNIPSTPHPEVLMQPGGSFAIDFALRNDSAGTTTFTGTMGENDFFGPEHTVFVREVEGDVGAFVSVHLSVETTASGADTVSIVVTSDFSPGVVLTRCEFVLRVERDADADGLVDDWETAGLDTDGDGVSDVTFDPNRKDLLLELDYVAGETLTRADIRAMKKAFDAAPLSNPDGSRGITLWVDTGDLVDLGVREGQTEGTCIDGRDNSGDRSTDAADDDCIGSDHLETSTEDPGFPTCADGVDSDADGLADGADPDCLVGDDLGGGNEITQTNICDLDYDADGDGTSEFYDAKAAEFDPTRALMFRYGIAGPGCDLDGDGTGDAGGWGEIGGNDFVDFNHDGGSIMHELGHTLNLRHGGDVGDNCKPNYVSVMNYDNQFGIRRNGGGKILDFSPPRIAFDGSTRGVVPDALQEDALSEMTALDAADPVNRFAFVDAAGLKLGWPLNADLDGDGTFDGGINDGVDWNGDGDDPPFEPGPLSTNIDTSSSRTGRPSACTNDVIRGEDAPLTGYDDWRAITLNFRAFGDSADGAINPNLEPEPTLEELQEIENTINATDLAVAVEDSPDPVAAGSDLSYAVTVANHGPNPATAPRLAVTPPDGVTVSSAEAPCFVDGSGVTCFLDELRPGQSTTVTVRFGVPAGLVHANGGPVTLDGAVSVFNLAGSDTDTTNDARRVVTRVIASADIAIASLTAVDPPTAVLLGETQAVTLRNVVQSAGPSSPMEASLTTTGRPSTGASVDPTSVTRSIPALSVGAPQTVDVTFGISCAEPGTHTYTFTSTVAPGRTSDQDANLSNNSAEMTVRVDCVVPIAVNIKPGGDPNSINRQGKTDISVAALTTDAGEYGLALPFDATSILPLSVRFGSPAALRSGGGASETHRAVHREDAFELDERTKDGDLDAVLHFAPSSAGFSASDTVGCLAGSFRASDGRIYSFYGCGPVRIVR